MNSHLLTQREKEIFTMLVDEMSTKEISDILGISEKTTRNHISNVIGKLGVKSRTQAILILVKNGMLSI
ncbi:MAG: response regulator transcription factor [Acholeplasmatales bacterium]|nr:response regulator transcription factor [Acholeplasmatales bacterium]